MAQEPSCLLRAAMIQSSPEITFRHPLNPDSEVHLRMLSRATGMQRAGVSVGRLAPGRESFIYHFHRHQEEWIYILSGRGVAEIGDESFEVGAGDFMGFTAPSPGHSLRNPFDQDLVYLMGGESTNFEVGVFPRHGKRAIFDGDSAHIVDDGDLTPFTPRAK